MEISVGTLLVMIWDHGLKQVNVGFGIHIGKLPAAANQNRADDHYMHAMFSISSQLPG